MVKRRRYVGIVYEIKDNGSWRPVSVEEYEHFQGRKRVRPKGIPVRFLEVTNLLLAYR